MNDKPSRHPSASPRSRLPRSSHWLLGGAVAVAAALAMLSLLRPDEGSDRVSAETPRLAAQNSQEEPGQEQGETPSMPLSGEVVERVDVDRYTYVRLRTSDPEPVWAAVPKAEVAVGQRLSVLDPQRMENFNSQTLKRSFDVIYFGRLGPASGPASPHAAAPASGGLPHGGSPVVEPPDRPLPRAAGELGRSVAEVHAQRQTLAGKRVRVRGLVVRSTVGVMGRTFVHLQDGTGEAARASNDLTVTTEAEPATGSVIEVEGVLAIDRDFGAGYSYAALLENATIVSSAERTKSP